jgi:hypothetical protein
MADKKISDLTALTGANVADTDLLPIVDTSATETKKITFGEFKTALDTATGFVRITGDTMTGDLSFGNNNKATFGDKAGGDLQIYHDSSHSYIKEVGTGDLLIYGTNLHLRDASGYDFINCTDTGTGGTVTLFNLGSAKLATTATGIDVTGTAEAHKVEIGDGSAGGTSEILFSDNVSARGKILYDHSSNPETMVFQTTGTTAISINNTQDVSIPNGNLDVTGTVVADGLTVDSSSAVIRSATGTASPTATTFNISTTSSGSDWATTSPWGRLAFYSGDGSGGGGKPHVVLDATASNAIGASSSFSVSTTSESANTLTQRLNIANDGDISFYEDTGTTAKLTWSAGTESLRFDSATLQAINGTDPFLSGNAYYDGSNWKYATSTDATNYYQTDRQHIWRNAASGTAGNNITWSESMRIDSSGNVGIGTSSPSGNLEIATSASDTGVDLVLDGNKTSNGGIGSIIFNNNGDSVGMIRSNRASANDAADMLFYTQATGGSNTERMRIDSSGIDVTGTVTADGLTATDAQIGYTGTSIPNGSNNQGLFIPTYNIGLAGNYSSINWPTTSASPSTSAWWMFGRSGSENTTQLKIRRNNGADVTAYVVAATGTDAAKIIDNHQWYTNGSERLRIDSSGNVGIGTSSPSEKLHVQGDGADILLTDAAGGQTAKLGATGSNNGLLELNNSAHTGTVFLSSSGDSYLNGGNVGIGTSSPARLIDLKVSANTDGGRIRLRSATAIDTYPTIGSVEFYSDDNSGSSSGIVGSIDVEGLGTWNGASNNAAMTFNLIQGLAGTTSPIEAARIDSSGNLLVGTTSNSVYNDVSGTGIALNAGEIQIAGTGTTLYANRQGSDGTIIDLRKDGAPVGSIGTFGGDLTLGTGTTQLRFNDGLDIIIPSTGAAARDATIGLGSSTNRFKDLYLSGGVVFNVAGGTGTSTSGTLDDYEEGTWTGTLTGSTSAPSTAITATGTYTKIGRSVTAVIAFSNKDSTGVSGNIVVTGLPFTAAAGGLGAGWNGRSNTGTGTTNGVMSFIASNNDLVLLNGLGASITWVSAGTGTYAGYSITYEV